ncbi:polymeric immunoglobulin receptor-like isoform X2 [Silurus meridionalis]|uniref:polymeric immunoglobulin receptor-like isoform X2 n=1 Tax=Silurus meridionalis TaxID=175797 RepID=UPI001EEB02BB|nr:polymeric immunoglobulin receptor-like isoform X2 [Silurus meridionalis]
MTILLFIFTLCLISDGGASKKVTGYSGGGVLIKCKYNTEYTQNLKSFCKGSWPACSDKIKTKDKNMWVTSGRYSLFDDTKSAEFWVMIRELTVEDTGTYRCGDHWNVLMNNYTLELEIKKGSSDSREVTAYAGTRSNIKCRYEDQYKHKPKSFWKIRTDQWSIKHINTEAHSEWSHDGRFSIHDNRSAGFFSVFIRELIIEDTGTYACAVAASDQIEIYTVVKLNVTEYASYEKSISKTVYVGGELSIYCKYPEFLKSSPKFLCKRPNLAACLYTATVKESRRFLKVGKITMYDDRENQIFTVSIKHVTEQDSNEYWCGAEVAWKFDYGYKVYFTRINLTVTGFPASTVIAVSVSLLLLLIGIFVVILLKRHKLNTQGPETVTHMFRETNEDHENDPEATYQSMHPVSFQLDPHYENITE